MEEKRPVTRADSIGSSEEKKDKKFKLNRNLLIYIAIILGVSMLLSAWIITAANDLLALDKPDEENLGELIYFFEKACAISGYMLGVNPFDQPGVESYKKNMFALLGKPGYEGEKEALEKRLGK